MKKNLTILLFVFCGFFYANAQSNLKRCSSETPSAEWDEWFNAKVEEFKLAQQNGRTKANTTYVIPVVFHVIYGTQNIGTYPNLSKAQVTSQIQILNDDFQGKGYNSNQYATMGTGGKLPFYNYAVANNLPAPNNNGVAIGSLSIEFKPVWVKPNGDTLTELGIDRISYSSKSWSNPASFTSATQFKNYMDNTIKPASIWDPTKYLNVWVTDCDQNVSLLGYSTFPSGTTLTGLGSGTGTSNTDGTWIWAQACGNVGTLTAGYNKGRTLTHELGHFLGLRHTWGDSNCGTDYCNDVPPSQTANYNAWPITYPFNTSTCTATGLYKSNATDGEMFMNFMDYCEDAAMWMFTNDQVTRMNTALTQSTNRKNLTASSLLVCKPDVGASAQTIAKQYLKTVTNVYPNPTNGLINISTDFASNTNLKVEVRNVVGQTVFTSIAKSVSSNVLQYDLSSLNKGIYFITLTSENGSAITQKIIFE
ncbi:MAG: hypothetical protein RL065_1406 [Bacteroidota bacterium]|jgi:hypothetical protein